MNGAAPVTATRANPTGMAVQTRRQEPSSTATVVEKFVRAQAVNSLRDAASLRPFRHGDFGTHPAAPTPAHLEAANELIGRLRRPLLRLAHRLEPGIGQQGEADAERLSATEAELQGVLHLRHTANSRAKLVESVWNYYLELFGQRQSRFAPQLLAMDRIALDCYQAIYTGLGSPRPVPTPPPLAYMETGFTPATFRRGIQLSKLARNVNPFPIVQLPYHRLVNPWTLGAVHHEVSHNIQNDLGLWNVVPRRIVSRLVKAGIPPEIARIWGRWHKEIWADLCAVLLGGPQIVTSIVDVLARPRGPTLSFNAAGVHPTPYLRTLINAELLRRMGFEKHAQAVEHLWHRLYPNPEQSNIPSAMLGSFADANRLVVETICYAPYRQLGSGSLADVFSFNQTHDGMAHEAAFRLARGVDPGIIPARFLVAAARHALDERIASPTQIARNFYRALELR